MTNLNDAIVVTKAGTPDASAFGGLRGRVGRVTSHLLVFGADEVRVSWDGYRDPIIHIRDLEYLEVVGHISADGLS